MRYNVDCPYCGKPRSLSDATLWPTVGARYPEPSEPQECLDCPGWMRVVIKGEVITAERALPRYQLYGNFDEGVNEAVEPDGDWVKWSDLERFLGT